VTLTLHTYDVISAIFSPVKIDDLKKREKEVINCNTAG